MRLFSLALSRFKPNTSLPSLDTCCAAFIVILTDCVSRKSLLMFESESERLMFDDLLYCKTRQLCYYKIPHRLKFT